MPLVTFIIANIKALCLFAEQIPLNLCGFQCAFSMRSMSSKIVCLTANVGAEMEKQFMQEGFDGYLSKPVNGKILESELVRLTTVDLIR